MGFLVFGEFQGAAVKATLFRRIVLIAITSLTLTSCSAAPNFGLGGASENSPEFIASKMACQEVESNVENASSVFQETISGRVRVGVIESVDFFISLGDLWGTAFKYSFGEPDVSQDLTASFRDAISFITEARGLLSKDYAPYEVGEILRPALSELFAACATWHKTNLVIDDLFPEIKPVVVDSSGPAFEFEDFNLMIASEQSVNLEPLMLAAAEAYGLVRCAKISGPYFEKFDWLEQRAIFTYCDLPTAADGTGGFIVFYRFEDTMETRRGINALLRFSEEIEPPFTSWLLYSNSMAIWASSTQIPDPVPFSLIWNMEIEATG